ncbi:MAG: YjdF family protein [Ruthenibacterium lactatiformans]
MQKSRASFTVFFEDPFWVGVYEREEPGGLTACRVVFGAEPKDGEIYEWMLHNWAQLHFGPPLADARRPRAENPKRARRMARRSLAVQGVGTKASGAGTGARCRQILPPRAGNRSRRTGRFCPARSAQEGVPQGRWAPVLSDCRKIKK